MILDEEDLERLTYKSSKAIMELQKRGLHEKRLVICKERYDGWKTPSDEREYSYKPAGMWYSAGTSWLEWAGIEMPDMIHDNIDVVEVDTAKMRVITTLPELDAFNQEYTDRARRLEGLSGFLDWPKVKAKYGGVEIAPYQWDRRLDTGFMWYYTWDVASGVIWDKSVLLSRKPALRWDDEKDSWLVAV